MMKPALSHVVTILWAKNKNHLSASSAKNPECIYFLYLQISFSSDSTTISPSSATTKSAATASSATAASSSSAASAASTTTTIVSITNGQQQLHDSCNGSDSGSKKVPGILFLSKGSGKNSGRAAAASGNGTTAAAATADAKAAAAKNTAAGVLNVHSQVSLKNSAAFLCFEHLLGK